VETLSPHEPTGEDSSWARKIANAHSNEDAAKYAGQQIFGHVEGKKKESFEITFTVGGKNTPNGRKKSNQRKKKVSLQRISIESHRGPGQLGEDTLQSRTPRRAIQTRGSAKEKKDLNLKISNPADIRRTEHARKKIKSRHEPSFVIQAEGLMRQSV